MEPLAAASHEKAEGARSLNHKAARCLGPAACPNGEHKSGVAPRAFWCPASLGPVGVPAAALGFVVVAVVVVVFVVFVVFAVGRRE